MKRSRLFAFAIIAGVLASPCAGFAQNSSQNFCAALPGYSQLQSALRAAVKPTGGPSNGGLDFNMWASIVGLDGSVCVVTFSGQSFTDQWLGSRVISAQKANTANDFSLNVLALSTPTFTRRCNRAEASMDCSTAILLMRGVPMPARLPNLERPTIL
jgi:hypothetical protein